MNQKLSNGPRRKCSSVIPKRADKESRGSHRAIKNNHCVAAEAAATKDDTQRATPEKTATSGVEVKDIILVDKDLRSAQECLGDFFLKTLAILRTSGDFFTARALRKKGLLGSIFIFF